MSSNKISFLFSLSLILSSLVSLDASASTIISQPPAASLQGEIAYVLDGNIWLYNLSTKESKQLTTEGGNRWPNWSIDGSYLLYTHSKSGSIGDLYILQPGLDETPKLLAKEACCAGWLPNSNQIAYISFASKDLSIKKIRSDGSGEEILLSPMTYEHDISPNGAIQWMQIKDRALNSSEYSDFMIIPLKVSVDSTNNELDTYGTTFIFDGRRLHPSPEGRIGCSVPGLNIANKSGESPYFAMPFEGKRCVEGGEMKSDKGIILGQDLPQGRRLLELPGLAFPTFSPDANYLAAEQYSRTGDDKKYNLVGLILYNIQNQVQRELVINGSQPAWRPTLSVDSTVAYYAKSDEHVVTIEPPLIWQGSTFRVHYIATGVYRDTSARLFYQKPPDYFSKNGINAFVVTKNGEVVTDPKLLHQIFLNYTAAYYLYAQLPSYIVPEFGQDLNLIIKNPLFIAMEPEQWLHTRSDQTTKALHAIITEQLSTKAKIEASFDEVSQQDLTTLESSLQTITELAKNANTDKKIFDAISEDLTSLYTKFENNTLWTKNASKIIRLATSFLYNSHVDQERAGWLSTYMTIFPVGEGSLDTDQRQAASTTLKEVDNAFRQRINILADFITDETLDQAIEVTNKAATTSATYLIKSIGEKYGFQAAANTASSILTAVPLALTVNSLIYGTDELFANFILAERSNELYQVFYRGRLKIQDSAISEYTNLQTPLSYNGNLAEQFRIAYLLETLAAIQSQRSYADGVTASFQWPNPVKWADFLQGKDIRAEAQDLRELADYIETDLINGIGNPIYIETAISLAINRTLQSSGTIVINPIKAEDSRLDSEWITYLDGNIIYDLLVEDDFIWAATPDGVLRWDGHSQSYVKLTKEDGLADNRITSIMRSNDRAIWFGTANGVSRLGADGRWWTYTVADGLATNVVSTIVQSEDGSIWFNNLKGFYELDGSGVSRLDDKGQWSIFTRSNGLADNSVTFIKQSTDGALWFGTMKGISRLDSQGHWRTFTTSDGLAEETNTSMLQASDDSIWFGAHGSVSHLGIDGSWQTLSTESLEGTFISVIAQGPDDSLWFGTQGRGVSRMYADGRWESYFGSDGFPADIVYSIEQGADGKLWFGTDDGIVHLEIDGQ